MILERFKVPVKDQVFVSEAALRKTVTQIFEKLGLTPDDAAEGADVLTMTDLRGVETHGVSNMLRAYVRDYKAGKLDPKPGWRIVRQTPGTAVIDAERRLGIIVGPKAMRLAVEKARTVGVGAVTVYNSRSEEHTSELQSLAYLVCRLLLEKKKKKRIATTSS